MNDTARRKLSEIVSEYGVSLCDDVRRCEGLLRDLCGEHKKEIWALVIAVEQRVPHDMLNSEGDTPFQLMSGRLTKRLLSEVALSEEAAEWAVNSWAMALGILSHSDLPRLKSRGDTLDDIVQETPETAKSDHEKSLTHYNLGRAAYDDDRLDDAIRELEEAIRIDPNYACSHYELGQVYYRQERWGNAIREYRKAIRIDPDYATAYRALGHCYVWQDREDDAVRACHTTYFKFCNGSCRSNSYIAVLQNGESIFS